MPHLIKVKKYSVEGGDENLAIFYTKCRVLNIVLHNEDTLKTNLIGASSSSGSSCGRSMQFTSARSDNIWEYNF